MNKVYLVVGVPGSGKTWVCNQLKDKFNYVPHDLHKDNYLEAILFCARNMNKSMLIETPFSISQLKEPLEQDGREIETVFILEDYSTVLNRYQAREGKNPSPGDRTRHETYRKRAEENGSFSGTSQEVLEYLKGKALSE